MGLHLRLKSREANVVLFVDIERLPGCNPLQHGPGPATLIEECDAISTTGLYQGGAKPTATSTASPK